MNPTPKLFRHRLHLVQVGLLGNVSAVAEQLDGECRGIWTITTDTSLAEFLARPTLEIPDGTPLVRLDLTGDDIYWSRVFNGPGWLAALPAGYIQPLLGRPRRHAGERWDDLPGGWAAADVYADLAPTAGVIVERLTGTARADDSAS